MARELQHIKELKMSGMSSRFKDGMYTGLATGSVEIQISRSDDNGRVRTEMSPYVIMEGDIAVPIFSKVGMIESDLKGLKPERPPGHCYEEHLSPTRRWDPKDHKNTYDMIVSIGSNTSMEWLFLYDDGGSKYYVSEHNPFIRRQVANSSGRTMIGINRLQQLMLSDKKGPFMIETFLQYRVVTDVGTDTKRSPVGTTQYAFGGFKR